MTIIVMAIAKMVTPIIIAILAILAVSCITRLVLKKYILSDVFNWMLNHI